MLDKFNFNGGRVTFLNKENALVSNSSINAGTLIFSNKGVMGPRNDTPMTIDEFIKAGRGRYETLSENDYITFKYHEYERNFYHDKYKKVRLMLKINILPINMALKNLCLIKIIKKL